MKKFDIDDLDAGARLAFLNLQAQRDALLESLKELLPYAEKQLKALNDTMVGSLYPAINLAKLNRAAKAIAQAETE